MWKICCKFTRSNMSCVPVKLYWFEHPCSLKIRNLQILATQKFLCDPLIFVTAAGNPGEESHKWMLLSKSAKSLEFGGVSGVSEGVRRAGEGADKASGVKWWAVFTWYQAGQEGDKMITRDLRQQGRVWRLLLPAAKWTGAPATHTVNTNSFPFTAALIIRDLFFPPSSLWAQFHLGRASSETRLRNLI
jgi:hypothetical protein